MESKGRRKEIRINVGIAQHDLATKTAQIKRLLNKGCEVKVCVFLRGRLQEHPQMGLDILNTVRFSLDGTAKLSGTPVLQGSPMSIFLIPAS